MWSNLAYGTGSSAKADTHAEFMLAAGTSRSQSMVLCHRNAGLTIIFGTSLFRRGCYIVTAAFPLSTSFTRLADEYCSTFNVLPL